MTLSTITTPFWEDPRFMARYGEAIRERREYVGFTTATSCANESIRLEREDPLSFKRFSQSSLSRWELDKTGEFIESAHSRSLRTLAYLLNWSSEQFERRVGVSIGRVPRLDLWLESGVPLMRVSRWLGHSDTRVTERVYIHLLREASDGESLSLERMLGEEEL